MDRDAYLNQVLIGGRETSDIRIVEYDAAWPVTYDRWARRITAALGPRALAVEHIGSTSVPGLAAKPVVDALLVVTDVATETDYLPELEQLGLVLRVRETSHRMLRTPERDVHLHVYASGRPEVRDYLALRERLRTSAADRQLYADTKRRLARQQWRDMNDYADAKSDVIRSILGRVC